MLGGEKEGPLSHGDLQEKLDQGEIDSSTKVWTQSQEDWLPICEVEHFNMAALDETPTIAIEREVAYKRETDKDYIRARPWIRFWARIFDYSLFIIALSYLMSYFNLGLGILSFYSEMIAIFFWVFVEAALLATVGTTPGKWLLRVTVRDENHQKLTFSGALNRSFSVWWLGMGAGLPIVSFVTMIVAAVKLNNTGLTVWDRQSELHVFHNKVGLTRVLIVILYFLCYTWVVLWGQLQIMSQQGL